MREILTDLIGKIVECYQCRWDTSNSGADLQLRGVVRAAYVTEKGGPVLMIEGLSEFDGGLRAAPRGVIGEMVPFGLNDGGVRVVEKCRQCLSWDHPSQLEHDPPDRTNPKIHRRGVKNGCRQ